MPTRRTNNKHGHRHIRKISLTKASKLFLEASTNGKEGWQQTLDGLYHPIAFFYANKTICTSNINRKDLRKAMIIFVGVVSITLAVNLQYHYIVKLSHMNSI